MAQLGERGQMLLIGAIVLAVTFVSLAVVLNGSIQTTTVASEASEDVSESEVITFQRSLQRDVSILMEDAYERDSSPKSSSSQVIDIGNHIDNRLNDAYEERHERRGEAVDVQISGYTGGSHVYQDMTGSFEHGGANWELTPSAQIREFEIIVEGWGGGSNEFRIDIDGGSDSIVIRDDGGDTEVEVNGQTCTDPSGPPTKVDITGGKVGGQSCPALAILDGSSVQVEFVNGNEIQGQYSVITSDTSANGANVEERVYDLEVETAYTSPSAHYDGTIRVAPGEPR